MTKNIHTRSEAHALQEALHANKVPYTLHYIYKDGQLDSMEYWQFEIADPTKLFDAVIANVYKTYQ